METDMLDSLWQLARADIKLDRPKGPLIARPVTLNTSFLL